LFFLLLLFLLLLFALMCLLCRRLLPLLLVLRCQKLLLPLFGPALLHEQLFLAPSPIDRLVLQFLSLPQFRFAPRLVLQPRALQLVLLPSRLTALLLPVRELLRGQLLLPQQLLFFGFLLQLLLPLCVRALLHLLPALLSCQGFLMRQHEVRLLLLLQRRSGAPPPARAEPPALRARLRLRLRLRRGRGALLYFVELVKLLWLHSEPTAACCAAREFGLLLRVLFCCLPPPLALARLRLAKGSTESILHFRVSENLRYRLRAIRSARRPRRGPRL